MEKILVSACLMGRKVRYDGGAKTSSAAVLADWRAEGRLVSFCPEVAGGLPVPTRYGVVGEVGEGARRPRVSGAL
ncbi:DUF523 domain-containing protein, partial [Nonomuraea wenchangensis]|uniref:DUF523 domain-containing protein n=1 Tax=Nonomuraea wenchangensis TaxID=568860 RepID=UPI00332C1AC2